MSRKQKILLTIIIIPIFIFNCFYVSLASENNLTNCSMNIIAYSYDKNDVWNCSFDISSKSEVVAVSFYDECTQDSYDFTLYSINDFSVNYTKNINDSSVLSDSKNSRYSNSTELHSVDLTTNRWATINYTDIYIFDSVENAKNYLKTGIVAGLKKDKRKLYDSELKLSDFKVNYHDSNNFDYCYIDFLYTIPDNYVDDNTISLDLSFEYNISITRLVGLDRKTKNHSFYCNETIDLKTNSNSYRIYLKDLKCFQDFYNEDSEAYYYVGSFVDTNISKRQILGKESFVDFDDSELFVFSKLGLSIDKSELVVNSSINYNNISGHSQVNIINLLTGDNSFYCLSPQDNNYVVNDSGHDGIYFTNVKTDDSGNNKFSYYYRYTDNSIVEIDSSDNSNNTVDNSNHTVNNETTENNNGSSSGKDGINITNNPTINNTITVEGDDITNKIENDITSDDVKDKQKNFLEVLAGFFALGKDNNFIKFFTAIFGFLPSEVTTIIFGAIGVIAVLAVYKFVKR